MLGEQVEGGHTEPNIVIILTQLSQSASSVMSGQGMAYNTLVSVSERMFPGITVGLGHNYNTMEYAAVKLGNQVVSSLALQLGRSHLSHSRKLNPSFL